MEQGLLSKEYCKQVENYLALMPNLTFDSMNIHLENLENSILSYFHEKFSNMSVSREEIHNIICNEYKQRNSNLKAAVDCNLGKAKFDFEDKKTDIQGVIINEIEKLKKLFTSVKGGTNYYYLGTVDKCVQELMGYLIRNHYSIAFSKSSETVKKDIKLLIGENYKLIMSSMGEELLIKTVIPLEKQFILINEFNNTDKIIVKQ